MEIGLQTFTIRSLLKTPKALDEAFSRVAGMGIKHLELAVDYIKYPFNAESARMIAEIAKRNNLKITSCQIKYKTSSADDKKTAEYLKILGAKTVTNSVIDLKLLVKGEDAVKSYCKTLNKLKHELDSEGIRLAHHNHHYEFIKYGGRSVLEIMAAEYSGDFALDTYWCQKGGGNVLTLLDDLSGRVPLMHLRDFRVEPFGLLSGGKDAELGNGNIPFKAIIEKAAEKGVKYGMIEQNTKTPLESVRQSLDFLKKIEAEARHEQS